MAGPERITSFTNDGFTFEVTDSGPLDGDVVVCLHGFPQPASSWDKVAARLIDAGRRVLAPTQRGYAPGAQPHARRAYSTDKLAGDIVALIDTVGRDRVHVAGHDWGGLVAWAIAALHPGRVATLTAVSTPHPAALRKAFTHSSQGLKSWYMGAFQIPWLPEKLLGARNTDRVRDGLARDGLSQDAAANCAQLLADPVTARGMINWYRALPFSARIPIGQIEVPTVYVWSDGDHYLGRYAAELTADWVTGPYRFVEIGGGTHWIPDEHPERLADAILAISSEYPTKDAVG